MFEKLSKLILAMNFVESFSPNRVLIDGRQSTWVMRSACVMYVYFTVRVGINSTVLYFRFIHFNFRHFRQSERSTVYNTSLEFHVSYSTFVYPDITREWFRLQNGHFYPYRHERVQERRILVEPHFSLKFRLGAHLPHALAFRGG